jgi:hypothetical protein
VGAEPWLGVAAPEGMVISGSLVKRPLPLGAVAYPGLAGPAKYRKPRYPQTPTALYPRTPNHRTG